MAHQCVRCNKLYENASKEILKGCTCGAKIFFFIKNPKKTEEPVVNLSKKEKKQIEEDVKDIVGEKETDSPIILDLESVKVVKTGKYEIDLVTLFKRDPLVYKVGEGKYMIDVIRSLGNYSKNKN